MCKRLQPCLLSLLLTLWLLAVATPTAVAAADPVVRAVMFYSPTCGHCHYVIETVLTPLMEQYDAQLQIIGVNTADPGGQALYQAAIEAFSIPAERHGVPTLIIGETVLVGSVEIPEQFPGLVESQLTQGDLDWPPIPGLAEALAQGAPTATPPPATTPSPTTAPTVGTGEAAASATPTSTPVPLLPSITPEETDWRARYALDPLGNTISVFVLLGMIVSVGINGVTLRREPSDAAAQRWQWAIPPLVMLGLIVAGYLAYVETQQVTAVCGPVGDCNAVQQSEYALLLGFLPIAVFGLLGYIAIGAAWVVARYAPTPWAALAKLALVGMTCFGVIFSIYLTFLEPFVIGATCAWCLTSAVVMTLLLWVVTPLTRPALRLLRTGKATQGSYAGGYNE